MIIKKTLVILALIMVSYSVHADDMKIAITAVKAKMKKSGNVFATTFAECKDRKGEYLSGEYMTKSQLLRVDSSTNAVLLTSAFCGGNGINKTLVLVKNSKPEIVKDFAMGDMEFLGEMRSISGRTIVFHGDKWKPDDAHCCPSQKAELRFNVDTGQQSLKVVK